METAVIVEDEFKVRKGLISMINDYCPNIKVIGEASNVRSALELITSNPPEIVFLDVRLPDGSGFDLLTKIIDLNLKVIFVTAYGDYALQAIKYSAIDYLLKPIIPDELVEAVDKAAKFIAHDREYHELSSLNDLSKGTKPKKIVIKTKTESHYVPINDILFCEADGNYTKIHILNQRPIMVAKTLKFYEEILSENDFVRSHQTFLVNLRHVLGFQQNKLTLTNDFEIEVSRRKRPVIESKLLQLKTK